MKFFLHFFGAGKGSPPRHRGHGDGEEEPHAKAAKSAKGESTQSTTEAQRAQRRRRGKGSSRTGRKGEMLKMGGENIFSVRRYVRAYAGGMKVFLHFFGVGESLPRSSQRHQVGEGRGPHAKGAKGGKSRLAGGGGPTVGRRGCRRGRVGRGVRSLHFRDWAHGSTDGPAGTSGNGLPLSWRGI